MALVTVQRTPSVVSSPQYSISEEEEDAQDDGDNKYEKSECFFAGKGTALILSLKDIPHCIAERRSSADSTKSTSSVVSNNSDIQQHLQSMFYLLRHEETLKMAVKLESQRPNRTRYLAIVSRCRNKVKKKQKIKADVQTSSSFEKDSNKCITEESSHIIDNNERIIKESVEFDDKTCQKESRNKLINKRTSTEKFNQKFVDVENEESCLLGIDCNEKTTIGMVLRILADTTIRLDGDGGFSISVFGKTHIFKPVSVQAMWSALQTLHKVSQKARESNFYAGGPSHNWVSYYENKINSDRSCLNEWNAMDAIESRRPPSPDAIRNKPREREETEKIIRMKLKEIMMSVDLDEVTSKYIRVRLEEHLDMDLGEYKSFIDEEMLIILGQMDAPTEIFEHVYLGSEWNASNLEELHRNGVRHILNVTREIDNFFPGMFDYFNVRVYDDEKTNLLKHWDNTFKYISRAKSEGSKVLVHCKMGVSRSASVVIAYAMKAYNWDFTQAMQHVKERRSCIKPNKNFLAQLETYRGMLDAMKNREKLQRSKSETNLKSVKDARLLPGSEPTPLIQALNNARKMETDFYTRTISRTSRRSSSTSPKSSKLRLNTSKQYSHSMENLMSNIKPNDEQRNIRFPGCNGQNYSVTQNQVRHIQKNSNTSSKSQKSNFQSSFFTPHKSNMIIPCSVLPACEIDEFEKICKNSLENENLKNSNQALHWTSSSQIIHQGTNLRAFNIKENKSVKEAKEYTKRDDIFSTHLDYVFENEENHKYEKDPHLNIWKSTTDPFFSRQSSCSSIDSAVVLSSSGEKHEFPSRHSSWGSGDNKKYFPSRNSSWGSYDTGRLTFCTNLLNAAIVEGKASQSPKLRSNEAKPDISYIGTVKRTKQKLEERNVQKKICSQKNQQNFLNELVLDGNISNSNNTTRGRQRQSNRSNSEELILNLGFPQYQHLLSVSAPEGGTYSLQHKHTSRLRGKSENISQEKSKSNVQSLKMSFEAKANLSSRNVKGRSLPSSPVAPHSEAKSKKDSGIRDKKEHSVKGLVNKYQCCELRTISTNCSRPRPKSFYENRSSLYTDLNLSSRFISNSSVKVLQKVNDLRKPPVPPVIKNAAESILITDQKNPLSFSYRKVQQHGKTHPLAKLNISKQSFNTAAYNTM